MRAYPVSLRHSILDAVDAGKRPSEVAALFGVGVSTVKRYRQQRRETGSLVPKRSPGRRPVIGTSHHAALEALVHDHPGASLESYCRLWWEATGRRVGISTLSRTLHRLGFGRRGAAP
jgi:transposase